MSKPRGQPRRTPLRPLTVRSAPFAKRALVWSPDAELAVAADDSVYVFVPQFGEEDGASGDTDEDGAIADETGAGLLPGSAADGGPSTTATATATSTATSTRNQFAAGGLHIPVSYPPLDVRVNQRLYAAAGLPFPVRLSAGSAAADYTRPSGAGSGPLTSAAGTMNSVVAVDWSPVGVGRNRRAVLGVLSAAGVLTVYGEDGGGGAAAAAGAAQSTRTSTAAQSSSTRRHYDTSRWAVLWAVGERMVVPPQTQGGACVVSFAWSATLAGGRQALLVYGTDEREVVVLRVAAGPVVYKVAQFGAAGPHPPGDVRDPHYVPDGGGGTAFGLRCSPWVTSYDEDDGTPTQTCLVGYLARNYVGFRRLTVCGSDVTVDTDDVDGLCLFLGADAFLEWEQGVWTVGSSSSSSSSSSGGGGQTVCRGVVATPSVAKAFEVPLSPSVRDHPSSPSHGGPPASHSLAACGTVYPPPGEAHTNPIQDLVIHPPGADMGRPTYTLVRASVTATNHDWFETNSTEPGDPAPQWAADIARRVQVRAIPNDVAAMDEDEPADTEGGDALAGSLHLAPSGTADLQQYRHRVRIWGLAMAPGGMPGRRGVTAVLATEHSAQQAERGSWYRDRSRVLFGLEAAAGATAEMGSAAWPNNYSEPLASAEARMWTWMYGGGPPVVPALDAGTDDCIDDRLDDRPPAFRELAAHQTCDICGAAMLAAGGSKTHAACQRGHVFDRCGATGLAIQRPGLSRVCGVCGSRTLRTDAVAAMLDGDGDGDAAALRQAVVGDVCGRCGGKFHD